MPEFNFSKSGRTSFEKFVPPITVFTILVSIGLFIGINLETGSITPEIYKRWGSPSPYDIFNGSYWGLITSNFLHTEIWHLAFNLYWIWFLGKKIEFETGTLYFVLLTITSALVSSFSMLGFSSTTGIGLSGIGYAFFGFIFIQSKKSQKFNGYIDERTNRLFFVWLIVCVILTKTKILAIGNAAHFGGLTWGIVLGFSTQFSKLKQWIFAGLTFLVIGTSFLWSPFSISWLSNQAFKLHKSQKIDEAIIVYEKILKRDLDNEFAKNNLAQLEKAKLHERAYKYHINLEYEKAREIYNEILKLDSTDTWAKENLERLPNEQITPN
ncbi:MAG: rhomboid family intramembrane serine protease [Flavobacteriales bacterium]|nr:rhomboid family intramembrane serine protease [Flavobacteriales bacterium]